MSTKFTLTGSNKANKQVRIVGKKDGDIFLTLEGFSNGDKSDFEIALECLKQAIEFKTGDEDIHLEHIHLTSSSIPAIIFHRESREAQPVVICIHGLNSNKNNTIKGAIQLAQEGYYTIIIDAELHGARAHVDDSILDINIDKNFVDNFVKVLKKTATDISAIIDELSQNSYADETRIGVTGNSMGGLITFLAATYDERISTIAPLVATPDWSVLKDHPSAKDIEHNKFDIIVKEDPIHNYKKLINTAVLIQNNIDDPIISIQGSRNIDPKLKELLLETPERYSYIEYDQTGHSVSLEMFDKVINWFNKFL